MANLDNISDVQKIDRENILQNIQELPEQSQRCWQEWKKMALPTSYIQAKNLVLCGMGGSGIAASIVKALANNTRIPIEICKNYQLPGFVSKDTLIIAISYSGNTEETVSVVKQAALKTNKIITISTGGKLASLATNFRSPHYKINYGSEPRAAIGYTLTSILAIFKKIDLLEISDQDFEEAMLVLQGLQKKIDLNINTGSNNAKLLANKLYNKIPIIFGADNLAPIGERWQQNFNENAKNASFSQFLPELNHNLVVGLQFPKDLKTKIFVIILESKYDHSRNKLRESITGQILDKYRINYEYVLIEPSPSPIAEIYQMIHFGDYVSFYLAVLNNIAPNPVEIIKYLKDKLAEKPLI